MATININKLTDPPKNLSMDDFKAYADMHGGPQRSCRFAVRFKFQGYDNLLTTLSQYSVLKDFTYLCEVAEMPGRGFANIDVRYYGPNQKLPFQTEYEDLNMTFICRNKSLERQFFDDWMSLINPVDTYNFTYRDQYACEIDIFQFTDSTGLLETKQNFSENGAINTRSSYQVIPQAEYCITLLDAYPLLVNPQPMTWQDDIFNRVIVNFTYSKWTRKGLDPKPGMSAWKDFSFNLVEGYSFTRE